MLLHGGKLLAAAIEESIPVTEWLDLSTGISPFAYPVPPVPEKFWHRLPEDEDGLLSAASSYYNVSESQLLAVAGSQQAIQSLPKLCQPARVGVLTPSYSEHAHAWKVCGHRVDEYTDAATLLESAKKLDCAIICSPNNPTGFRWERFQIERLANDLSKNCGLLIVDEAFIDGTPQHSVIDLAAKTNIVVLRSLGKFFGLAGARIGFVAANRTTIALLRELLGPWTISGPTRFAALTALSDRSWQNFQRQRLQRASTSLLNVMHNCGLPPHGITEYFHWVNTDESRQIYAQLKRKAILVRPFEQPLGLRFGLPASSQDLERLTLALQSILN